MGSIESHPHLLIGPLPPSQAFLPAEYCLVTKKVGRCRGSFPRWYYDPKEQICRSFVYGGCLGNKNNYLREEECKLACRDVQGGPLHGGFGAQVTFPQGRWSLSTSQGGGHESPPSSSLLGPVPVSSHFFVFSFPGSSKERHHPGGLCSFPYSPHSCQISSPYHVHALDQAAFAQPIPPLILSGQSTSTPPLAA